MVVPAFESTTAVILAGVHVWEESAFDRATPRPLLPVLQSPLICHVLHWLGSGAVREATICANSASRAVRRYLGSGACLNMDLQYYEDWTPRGPAGCVRDAVAHSSAGTVVVAEGTILPRIDLTRLLDAHRRSGAAATVVVGAERIGLARSEHLAPVGIYVFERAALDCAGAVGYQDIKEVLVPRLHAAGHSVAAYRAEAPCPRVSSPEDYLGVNRWLLESMSDDPDGIPHYRRVEQAYVHETARVAPTARLIGAVMIGPDVRVGEGAMLVGPCVVGSESVIDAGAVICRSIIWEQCRVAAGAWLDHCILTHEARVESGVRARNTVCVPTPDGSSLLGRLLRSHSPRVAKAYTRAQVAGLEVEPAAHSRRADAPQMPGASVGVPAA